MSNRFGFLYNPETNNNAPSINETTYNDVSQVNNEITKQETSIQAMGKSIQQMQVISHAPVYKPYADDFEFLEEEMQNAKQMKKPEQTASAQAQNKAEVVSEQDYSTTMRRP
jgi:hypothetical protein